MTLSRLCLEPHLLLRTDVRRRAAYYFELTIGTEQCQNLALKREPNRELM